MTHQFGDRAVRVTVITTGDGNRGTNILIQGMSQNINNCTVKQYQYIT